MDALLETPSPEPQYPISDPANTIGENKRMKPSTLEKRKKKDIMNNDEACSSCSSSSISIPNSTQRVSRVAYRLRKPTARLGIARRSVGERQAEALAIPLGLTFAAFANLLLERTSAVNQNVYVDDLAEISATTVQKILANVYGNKLGSFATHFESSFNNTLMIRKVFDQSASFPHKLDRNNIESYNLDRSTIDGCSDSEPSAKESSSATSAYEVIQGGVRTTSLMNEIVLYEENQQLSCVPRSSGSSTIKESLDRANDLKSIQNCLTRRKLDLKETELAQNKDLMRLKETELVLRYDSNNLCSESNNIISESNNLCSESNNLVKSKLEMDGSKFKTDQEDKIMADMVTKIKDWLVISVFIMLTSMLYGAYVFSQQRIMEATSICTPSEEKSSSWWVPKQVSSISTEFYILICRLKVWVQSFFGFLMILVVTYFIIKRSSGTKQTLPVSFIIIFLGLLCGLAGMFCVNTLGGSGEVWWSLWGILCGFQFLANFFTLPLYGLMYGPLSMNQVTKSSPHNNMVPYWARRLFFLGASVGTSCDQWSLSICNIY